MHVGSSSASATPLTELVERVVQNRDFIINVLKLDRNEVYSVLPSDDAGDKFAQVTCALCASADYDSEIIYDFWSMPAASMNIARKSACTRRWNICMRAEVEHACERRWNMHAGGGETCMPAKGSEPCRSLNTINESVLKNLGNHSVEDRSAPGHYEGVISAHVRHYHQRPRRQSRNRRHDVINT